MNMGSNIVSIIRDEAKKEQVITVDLQYIQQKIDEWFKTVKIQSTPIPQLRLELISLLVQNLNKEHLEYTNMIYMRNISAVSFTNVFSIDDYKLAFLVHEALCDMFNLCDIKYPYESHKMLYLKPGGENYKEWGNGYGEITPHSDDLYEDLDTDLLALTVCRDTTSTHTTGYMLKDIIAMLDDDDIDCMLNTDVEFISGKNVSIVKRRTRKLLEYTESLGIKGCLDFRIDNHAGPRMRAVDSMASRILEKLRHVIKSCRWVEFTPITGTFSIVNNYKILHARSAMHLDFATAQMVANNSNFQNTPRLLYRSKGPKRHITI